MIYRLLVHELSTDNMIWIEQGILEALQKVSANKSIINVNKTDVQEQLGAPYCQQKNYLFHICQAQCWHIKMDIKSIEKLH